MSKGTLAFSVKAEYCRWDYFRVGGNGGQKVNKTNSGVRVTHPESGATGQATDTRSQHQNRRLAWERMVKSPQFKVWINRKLVQGPSAEERVEQDMQLHNLRVEIKQDGKWVEETI